MDQEGGVNPEIRYDRRLEGIEACVFDAYGTLFDVHSAVDRHRARLGEAADSVSATWRAKQLQYTWLRSLMHRWTEFAEVTADALDFALDEAGVEDHDLRRDLLDAYRSLECYPEVTRVLEALRDGGMRTAILSNGSRAMLDAAVTSAGIGSRLDAVLSVDEVHVYKPHPDVYGLACTRLGVQRREVCFLSSNAWDAAGAATFGFRVVWVNRFGQVREQLPDAPEVEVETLDPLPGLVLG